METLLIVLFVIAVVLAVIVFSPVMVSVDSHHRQVRIRCLFALEFETPLPWTAGPKRFAIFHRPMPLRERQPSTEAPGVKKEKSGKPAAEVQKARAKRRATARFLAHCLRNSGIRRPLARQLSVLLKRISRSANLTRSEIVISSPDPAFNGMLAGVLAAIDPIDRSGMRVNFRSKNSLFFELRLHPHRVLKAFLFFMAGLPHRALFRQWRSFAALQRH
ncbi:MAG TPA: hypothetical protein VFZ27_10140 [Terriglobia bacterium]|nr:hypothetical protein [Terriglobia bacterium]